MMLVMMESQCFSTDMWYQAFLAKGNSGKLIDISPPFFKARGLYFHITLFMILQNNYLNPS